MTSTKILLLTNQDSGNVGDLLIEEALAALIRGVMHNLSFPSKQYSISSQPSGSNSRRVLQDTDSIAEVSPQAELSSADLIIFSAASPFSYLRKDSSADIVEILGFAKDSAVPVLLCGLGSEQLKHTDSKDSELQRALRFDCVKQITIVDSGSPLDEYLKGTTIPTIKVSDPVVLASSMMHRSVSLTPSSKTKIGLVITRPKLTGTGSSPHSESEQQQLWWDVVRELELRGYDYTIFSTGEHTDEEFLASIFQNAEVPESKFRFNINTPEKLMGEVTECSGVVSLSLYASIVSYAVDVPSISLVKDAETAQFYARTGHSMRVIGSENWHARELVDAIEMAISQDSKRDDSHLMSSYNLLFDGIKEILDEGSPITPYTYAELESYLRSDADKNPKAAPVTPAQTKEAHATLERKTGNAPLISLFRRASRKLRKIAKRVLAR